MQPKDFKGWSKLKVALDDKTFGRPGYKVREIWWMHTGLNVGFEENGKGNTFVRPVLVLAAFSRELFWGIPLTSNHKTGTYYFTFEYSNYKSTAILSQLRAYDSKRLVRKFGEMNKTDHYKITVKVKALF